MRKVICTIGAVALLICLFVTVALMIGSAICDIQSDPLWKVSIVELIGMTVCYIGIGDWMDE